MSKRDEIVEMAQRMCPHFDNGKCTASPLLFKDARCNLNCEYAGYGEEIYDAGYRKQRKSKWIQCADGSAYCLRCGRAQKVKTKCCPNCGADMDRKKANDG